MKGNVQVSEKDDKEYQRVKPEIERTVKDVLHSGYGKVTIIIRDGIIRFVDPTFTQLTAPEVFRRHEPIQ